MIRKLDLRFLNAVFSVNKTTFRLLLRHTLYGIKINLFWLFLTFNLLSFNLFSFDSQLIEDNRSHFRGRQSGNRLESDKNDSLPGERRSRRRRRKHNRNCEQPGQCPEGGANWRRPHRRGKKHLTVLYYR
ncbi:uncharacterized protein DC041_0005111 [Schistosoma bovis]|uniref:Uncharacterized protein n=1 Tax=Schistosoma bovis TaxID=6184 RepID=A0A430QLD2_SCHBO|nr:uncharacterized protein DC041_0005111 [Schistosoma bovis]